MGVEQKKSIYLRDPIQAVLKNRPAGEALSFRVNQAVERYRAIIQAENPMDAFTEAETNLIMDALNGTILDAASIPLIWVSVQDAILLSELADKWGVDGPALVAKLKGLTPGGCFALAERVESFWAARE